MEGGGVGGIRIVGDVGGVWERFDDEVEDE